jgi:hypothetical protein
VHESRDLGHLDLKEGDSTIMINRILFLAAAMIAVVPTVRATDCAARCRVPAVAELNAEYVEIDANSGKIIAGRTRFPKTETVQVLLVHKNPFKYQYRTDVRVEELEVGIARNFLTDVLGISTTAHQFDPNTVAGTSNCPAPTLVAKRDALDAALLEATTLAADLEKDMSALADASKAYNDFLQVTDKDPIDCEKICLLVPDVRKALDLLKDVSNLRKRLTTLQQKTTGVKTQLADFAAAVNNLTDATSKQQCVLGAVTPITGEADKLVTAAAKYDKALAELEKDENKKAIAALVEAIDTLNDESFVESRMVPTGGDALVLVDIRTKNLRTQDAEQVRTIKLTVGESRITASAGVGFSTIEDVTVIRQRAADPADPTKIIEVFGEENASGFRPAAVAMLNANIGSPFHFLKLRTAPALFSWSLGLVIASRAEGAQTEYITGPSVGFLENKVVFTFGYHAARVARLGGGFKIGDPIPAALQDPLPVKHEWDGGFLLGVTYRFE